MKFHKLIIYSFFSIILSLVTLNNTQAQLSYSIETISPTWTTTIGTTPALGNITVAGNDYTSAYILESASDHVKLDVELFIALSAVKVNVSKQDITEWPNNLKLSVKRNGSGTGLCLLCSINSGTTYTSVDNNSKEFFTIASVLTLFKVRNIPLQYKLEGASVTMSGKNYQTRVIYTIGAP